MLTENNARSRFGNYYLIWFLPNWRERVTYAEGENLGLTEPHAGFSPLGTEWGEETESWQKKLRLAWLMVDRRVYFTRFPH